MYSKWDNEEKIFHFGCLLLIMVGGSRFCFESELNLGKGEFKLEFVTPKAILFFFFAALLMGGCHRAPLQCRTEYLRPDYLASNQVSTPDPCRECFYGEQIVVKWDLPCVSVDATLLLHLRYGNRETEVVSHFINTRKGYWTYRLVNDPYWCREGILSYRAEIWENGELLADWTHHLYTELIEF